MGNNYIVIKQVSDLRRVQSEVTELN